MSDSPSAVPAPQPPPDPADGTAAPTADLDAAAVPHESLIRTRVLAALDRPLAGGFAATVGVLGALVLGSAVLSISTILVYIVLALFLALGLDPIVRLLERHNVKRGAGIGIVFGAFALLMTAFLVFVLPPVLAQIGQFIQAIPQALDEMPESEWFLELPAEWQIGLGTAIDQLAVTLSDPAFLAAVGGGVLVGRRRHHRRDLGRLHRRRPHAVLPRFAAGDEERPLLARPGSQPAQAEQHDRAHHGVGRQRAHRFGHAGVARTPPRSSCSTS